MPSVIRDGDSSSHGGYIVASQTKVNDAGKAVCVDQDIHVCPIPFHGRTPVTGTSKVFVDGKAVVLEGNTAGCGAVMQASQSEVTTG